MPLPSPFENVDDHGLVAACARGDGEAFDALVRRHGRMIRAIAHRVADERDEPLEVAPIVEALEAYLRRNAFGPLRTFTGTRLPVFLALATRELGAKGAHPPSFSGFAPVTLVDDLLGGVREPAEAAEVELERLSPHVSVMLRLRLHGLGTTGIAAALGTTRPAVRHQMGLIAKHLGRGEASSTEAFRVVLGHASPAERVALALRTETDPDFRRARRAALATWEAFRDRVQHRRPTPSRVCLSMDGLASLADGSLRGPSRAEAEGHVGSCAHCADRLASLITDQDVLTPIRETAKHEEPLAQLATAVSTLRLSLASALAEPAQDVDPKRTRALLRVVEAAKRAQTLARPGSDPPDESRASDAPIPSDEEAPVVALEALASGTPKSAVRAIDDHLARRNVGRRARLLALASLGRHGEVHAMARDIMERSSVDPELARDVDVAVALPKDTALPNEILAERLRTLVPDVVRYVLEPGR